MPSNDISMYSDSELADYFDNDEGLYQAACIATRFSELEELASEVFIYNADQLAELKQDFEDGRY